VLRAAIEAVDAGGLVQRACDQPDIVSALQLAGSVDVIAAGKASGAMLNAFVASSSVPFRHVMGVAPAAPAVVPEGTEWFVGGHPLPNDGSLMAAARALSIAQRASANDLMVVLLSGGGSALMALPAESLSLHDKQDTAHRLMAHGADIYELNTVRKHLSSIKGGQLAAATQARVITMAVSDVVGDDLSVIASGPTVADNSTFSDALAVIDRRGGEAMYPPPVVARLQAGIEGRVPDTPPTGDPRLGRSRAYVIGKQRGAIDGARRAAESLGYGVIVINEPVTGEARVTAPEYVKRVAAEMATRPRPVCVISAGETTVTVKGRGKGGRNQEFALAMVPVLTTLGAEVAAASIGTDGIDGPTDAAGAAVDHTSAQRAAALGLDAQHHLDDNNTYAFFDRLGDLIRTGPTSTNVGDLQVMLIA
jgi:hydroxypyruvate reductase